MGEADVTLSQTEEKPPDSALVPGEDSVVWSHEVEVCLFHAMIGHKPVGKTANASSSANISHWNQSENSLTRTLDGPRPVQPTSETYWDQFKQKLGQSDPSLSLVASAIWRKKSGS